jgi:outer membrane receptor protein involved in Fe transport
VNEAATVRLKNNSSREKLMIVRKRRGRLLVTSALAGAAFFGGVASAAAVAETLKPADKTYQFDIPAESLGQALTDFSQASSQQIIFSESLVKGRKTAGLHGTFTAAQALNALLSGTDLAIETSTSGVLMVQPKNVRAALDEGAAVQPVAQQGPVQAAPPPASPEGADELQTIVVTGSTSKRTVLNASLAVTSISSSDLDQKAPRGTDDVLEMVPGIFVEGTAGPVSNNYSVRGLPGGGQEFIRLIEDGMPAIYGGLNDDEVFQNDLSIDHVEALEGGSSGILTPNAAGASINFISRKLNFDQGGGVGRIMGTTYGDRRADLWYSAPIPGLKETAFAVSGYYDSNPGTRDSPFRYDTYHMKLQLEHDFDDASVRLTYKNWDEHDPYYADQPYAYINGKITGVPGLDTQFGSIIGKGFANITVPDSCAAGECFRTFSEQQGIHATGNEYRIDAEKSFNDDLSVFAKARYTETHWDFNGVFAGSGTGNSGLASAVTYLTNNSNSPIQSLLQAGQTAFPAATQFGIRNLTNGQVIPASNVAALNALNGNGLLEQTVLNRQLIKLTDWGSDFGVKWDYHGDNWSNSLTVGGMVYSTHIEGDQSGVSTVVNDVANGSNIYDIVALNGAGAVLGTLSNNGLISYGDWGQGISNSDQNSESAYINNEFTWNDRLHVDFGLRYEHESETANGGNSSSLPIPAGVGGVVQVNPNAFNGTFSSNSGHESPVNVTAGINYTLASNLSVYGRYEHAYQTQGTNTEATAVTLYEGGVTYSDYGLTGTVRGFRTEFNNQSWGGGVASDPNLTQGFFGDSQTNGVDLDLFYRPTYEPLKAFAVHAQATFQDPTFSNVRTGVITVNGQNIAQQVETFYDGKTPGRTPNMMYTITPEYDLPDHLGQIYLRYKYIGRIYADNGDQVVLPGYGVVTIGGIWNVTPYATLNVSVDNVTNELGLTEGNPRQGFTQSIVNGYFYGRGIVGPTGMVSLTAKF